MHKITAGRLYIPTGNLIRPTKTAQTDGLSNYLTKVNKAKEFYYGTDWERTLQRAPTYQAKIRATQKIHLLQKIILRIQQRKILKQITIIQLQRMIMKKYYMILERQLECTEIGGSKMLLGAHDYYQMIKMIL